MKFRKKPVEIDAIQFVDDEIDTLIAIKKFMGHAFDIKYEGREPKILIPTLEGVMKASVGDYIIKGVRGEFYPCKPDIFLETYEVIS